MSRTVFCPEEVIVVSKGKEDIGRLVALGNDGKFDTSVIPVIDDLQTQITAEVTARSEADTQLQANIDAEALARTNADAKLQSNIEVEANARTAADQNLQDQISKEVAARTDGDTALQSNVDAEVTARTNADEAESSTRASADKSLQEEIDVLKSKNAFSNVVVNGTTIQADSQTDTIELEAGTNIALTADAINEKVTIAVTGKVASAAQADSATTASKATTADLATTTASCTGNAATATKLETARTIAISGKVTGTATAFDGSSLISIPVTAVTADNCTGNSATATLASAVPWSGVTGKPTIPSVIGSRVWISGTYTPVQNAPTIVNHGIAGLDPLYARGEVLLRCVVAEFGYSVGDYAIGWNVTNNGNARGTNVAVSESTIQFNTAGLFMAMNKTTAAGVALTFTNWEYIFRIWY